jgi:hypothetical protein
MRFSEFFQHVKDMRKKQLIVIQTLEKELVKEKEKFKNFLCALPVEIE